MCFIIGGQSLSQVSCAEFVNCSVQSVKESVCLAALETTSAGSSVPSCQRHINSVLSVLANRPFRAQMEKILVWMEGV